MVCLGRPYHFEFFKGCLLQISHGPFLNTLTQKNIYVHREFISDSLNVIREFLSHDTYCYLVIHSRQSFVFDSEFDPKFNYSLMLSDCSLQTMFNLE